MYPFGSGMPSHPPTSTNHHHEPPRAPFGAGWVPPMQQNSPYPPPSSQPHPYSQPSSQMHQQQQHYQYPGQQGGGAPAPYPPMSAPYPSATPSYPPYPSANPYPSQYPPPLHHQQQQQPFSNSPYPTDRGYTPAMTAGFDAGYGYGNGQGHGQGQGQGQGHGQGHGHGQGYGHGQGHGNGQGHAHRSLTAHREGTPTVVPAQGFDPVKDAHDLRKAMKGFGTDEDALINIICRRSNEQRQEIQRQFKTHFGKDLIEDIKSETSGNFEKLLVGLLRPIVDYYCAELNDAMAGLGTDEEVLIEILCTLSNMEIYTIKNQYLRLYGAHLESELKSETSGNFKRLLTSLCTAARDESGRVDPNAAKNDARELLKAGELRVGTDESMFNMILCQRNYQQLKMIFQEYESMTGHSLEKAIKKEFSGDVMEGLIAIYRCVTNKAEYFASRLHKAMAGIGTNDTQLIRVIITRSEIDMTDIKVAFERLYGKSLKSWIKGDTSGHYKHALYALVGEQRSS
ncbi:annexin B11 isoform X1 [Drosophila eugracilis]|uniref:annexin B11 isoform X1 n=1 Tax=Drosophila eugracilis TaxID=29029 RepID=UPI0007E6E574|nr:annexin B11 isoform X1 [Drosophila eugracilis]